MSQRTIQKLVDSGVLRILSQPSAESMALVKRLSREQKKLETPYDPCAGQYPWPSFPIWDFDYSGSIH